MVNIEEIPETGQDKIYQELLGFLTSHRNDLRKAAAEATLASLSPAIHGINHESASKLACLDAIRPLCRIASSSNGSMEALASLSLLCSHDLVGNQCVLDFIEAGGIGRMIEIALEPYPAKASEETLSEWRKRVNYACALLANGTRVERGAVEFVGLSFPEEAVPSNLVDSGTQNESADSTASEEKKSNDPSAAFKRDARPTATLLLSRLLNPSFIDTLSPQYKSSIEAMNCKLKDVAYDSDLDENGLDEELPHNDHDLQHQKSQPVKGDGHYDPYQHVAAVLMNITQLESGRKFLMKLMHKQTAPSKDTSYSTSHLQSILPELNSPNFHRRRGIAGTLKNCCFCQDSTWWLLNVVRLDKALLLPLAGPEELSIDEKVGLDPDFWLSGPSKVREPDPIVRLSLTEAILLLLASGRNARETLRQRRTYVIIKMADMVEENEEISERMNECVQYLRRDEDGEEEGSSDRRAYEACARGMVERNGGWGGVLPVGVASRDKESEIEIDYDNID